MNISRNWLQTYFENEIPSAEKLAELFTFHFCEVEGVENSLRRDLKEADSILDLKILPDRAHYALSHKGVAGEVSLLAKLPIKERFVKEIASTIKEVPIIKIENPKFCRRYTARISDACLPDRQVAHRCESPAWLKNALESIGQRSINVIVDLTNYVMYDIGQPLHAFDADKVIGSIVIRAAKEGEKIVLLDGREITLNSTDNVIADDEGPLVIAGAKGGKRAEISETTKRIIIESANFDPTAVRKTSTKYDIRSDSSKRFENEITPELAIHGMHNVCALIQQIMPEAKFGPIVDQYLVKAKQTVIEFDPNYLEERLGVKVPLDEAKNILEGMGIGVTEGSVPVIPTKAGIQDVTATSGSNGNILDSRLRGNDKRDADGNDMEANDNKWSLTIPYERLDLVIKEDIVEEVGRIYGYDHVVGILPPPSNENKSILPSFYLSEKIKNILVSQGFSEVSLYTLVEKGDIETAKPLAKDKAFARKNLSDGMLACVEKNALNADLLGLESIKVFEIGHVFSHESEDIYLVLGAAQIKKIKGLNSETIVNETVKKLESELGVSLKGQLIKNKAGNYSVYEINLEPIIKSFKSGTYEALNLHPSSSNRYQKFSLYPFIVRDIAIFVPELVTGENVWKVIEKGIGEAKASDLLVRHALFDTFKKEGKVSYAFRLVFQSMERTLTDDEANKIMEIIYDGLKREGWEVR